MRRRQKREDWTDGNWEVKRQDEKPASDSGGEDSSDDSMLDDLDDDSALAAYVGTANSGRTVVAVAFRTRPALRLHQTTTTVDQAPLRPSQLVCGANMANVPGTERSGCNR